jgi:hypothetical protein
MMLDNDFIELKTIKSESRHGKSLPAISPMFSKGSAFLEVPHTIHGPRHSQLRRHEQEPYNFAANSRIS